MTKFWLWLMYFAARRAGRNVLDIPADFDKLLAVAEALTAEANKLEGVSGEFKLHQVYAAMLKTFDEPIKAGLLKKRNISLAIQVALNRSSRH